MKAWSVNIRDTNNGANNLWAKVHQDRGFELGGAATSKWELPAVLWLTLNPVDYILGCLRTGQIEKTDTENVKRVRRVRSFVSDQGESGFDRRHSTSLQNGHRDLGIRSDIFPLKSPDSSTDFHTRAGMMTPSLSLLGLTWWLKRIQRWSIKRSSKC